MASDRDPIRCRDKTAYREILRTDAIIASAHRDPGKNMEIGLMLGDYAIRAGYRKPPVEKPSMISLWRKLKARRADLGQTECQPVKI